MYQLQPRLDVQSTKNPHTDMASDDEVTDTLLKDDKVERERRGAEIETTDDLDEEESKKTTWMVWLGKLAIIGLFGCLIGIIIYAGYGGPDNKCTEVCCEAICWDHCGAQCNYSVVMSKTVATRVRKEAKDSTYQNKAEEKDYHHIVRDVWRRSRVDEHSKE